MEFLVRGQQFLVGRLQLFVDGFKLFNGRPEIVLRHLELVLQVGNSLSRRFVVSYFSVMPSNCTDLCSTNRMASRPVSALEKSDMGCTDQVDEFTAIRAIHGDAGVGDGALFRAATVDCGGGNEVDILIDQSEKIEGGLAGGYIQVIRIIAEEMNHIILFVQNDEAGRNLSRNCE